MSAACRLTLASTLVAASCLTAAPARSQPSDTDARRDEAVTLVYDAPASCPTREDLLAAVEARRPPRVSRAGDARTFIVRLQPSRRGGFDARLDVSRSGEPTTTREVHASSCAAAMTSVAVFITLALAPTDEPADADAAIDDGASTASDDEASTAAPGARALPLPRGEGGRAAPRASAPRGRPPSPAARAPASYVWTGGASLAAAELGALATGARVSAELARVAPSARAGLALRLSYGWADFSVVPPLAGEARFRLSDAQVEPCLLARSQRLYVSACAAGQLGALSATATGVPVSGRAMMPWIAAGTSARLRVHLTHGLSLEAGIAALVPFIRRTFALADPVRPVFRPAPLLLEGSLGLAMSASF